MSSLRHPTVDAALATAATLLEMEVVLVTVVSDTACRFERVHGAGWPGVEEGRVTEREDWFCHRMLSGAPPATSDAASDPAYADVPAREELGVRSYVGVPIHRADGTVAATLCGMDRRRVVVDGARLGVLRGLAAIVALYLPNGEAPHVVIRRTPGGWAVGETGEHEPHLATAMVLADLLHADLTPGGRPPRGGDQMDETARLRLAVEQLQHALAARVTVEQAIGVVAERFAVPPREAFDRLRRVARRHGVRVHDLSRDVVASVTAPVTALPAELRGTP